jgi:predicted DNA-binding mobile mystery protein A
VIGGVVNSRELLRRQLDARLKKLPQTQPPNGGWIRAIRLALGMTMAQLGRRLNISAPGISALESRENRGAISLSKLRDAADAMGCDLSIAFVPRVPLAEMVRRQAVAKARQQHNRVLHTMNLEDQGDGVLQAADLEKSVEGWLTKRTSRLWD